MMPAACSMTNKTLAARLRELDQFDRETRGMGYFNPHLTKNPTFSSIFKNRRKHGKVVPVQRNP